MERSDGFVTKHAEDLRVESVDATNGLERTVLIDADDGAENVALRLFTLVSGGSVPRHTNEIEHVQYALQGDYVVGVGDEEHRVEAGDAMLIPAGAVHWYRNPTDHAVRFLCAVPHGDDEIRLVDE